MVVSSSFKCIYFEIFLKKISYSVYWPFLVTVNTCSFEDYSLVWFHYFYHFTILFVEICYQVWDRNIYTVNANKCHWWFLSVFFFPSLLEKIVFSAVYLMLWWMLQHVTMHTKYSHWRFSTKKDSIIRTSKSNYFLSKVKLSIW